MPFDQNGRYQPRAGTFNGPNIFAKFQEADRDINADDMDRIFADLKTALELCLLRNGVNTPTANLPMAGRRHTNCGDAQSDNEYMTLGQRIDTPVAVTFASALAWNAALAPIGTVTLTGTVTSLTLSNTVNGGVYTLLITQDATGGRTLAIPSAWKWPENAEKEIAAGANQISMLTVRRIGETIYAAPIMKNFT